VVFHVVLKDRATKPVSHRCIQLLACWKHYWYQLSNNWTNLNLTDWFVIKRKEEIAVLNINQTKRKQYLLNSEIFDATNVFHPYKCTSTDVLRATGSNTPQKTPQRWGSGTQQSFRDQRPSTWRGVCFSRGRRGHFREQVPCRCLCS